MSCPITSVPHFLPAPLAHSAPVTIASLLFLQHMRQVPTSELLHLLFPLLVNLILQTPT